MARLLKLFSFVGVLLLGFSVLTGVGTSVYAAETVKSESELKEEAVASLKFYLEDAGYIDQKTNKYVVTDFTAIKAKANLSGPDGEAGKFILENFVVPNMTRSIPKYAACVVINSLPFGGIIWDGLQGESTMQTFINALQSQNYDLAVDLLTDVAKKTLSPKQFAKFNVATVAASLALNAISCWGN
ncbi:streptococcin A-M57 [Enterococcus gallinarum]|uniref:streptococcin A-M57 n=1 Tax=Enterococcus gallinarum TaxID=1353 RepID=UPI002091660C|nr:streptococcin A-M57 [Enterococcus gallinarum]MCO5478380.1 streptococcin A-M57 [Enterococcus gallinarum]